MQLHFSIAYKKFLKTSKSYVLETIPVDKNDIRTGRGVLERIFYQNPSDKYTIKNIIKISWDSTLDNQRMMGVDYEYLNEKYEVISTLTATGNQGAIYDHISYPEKIYNNEKIELYRQEARKSQEDESPVEGVYWRFVSVDDSIGTSSLLVCDAILDMETAKIGLKKYYIFAIISEFEIELTDIIFLYENNLGQIRYKVIQSTEISSFISLDLFVKH